MSIIELQNIGKTYGKGESATEALKDINLRIECGEFWSIMGPSGSGKSTLLNILGCMDIPTSGTYLLNGEIVNTLKNEQLSVVRNKTISFVFQHFALLNDYSVYDNIMLPLNCRKMSAGEKKKRVKYYMKRLGIEQLAKSILHRYQEDNSKELL